MNEAHPESGPKKAKKPRKTVEVSETVRVLAANLRRIRQTRGLSQLQVAAAAGTDYKHYQKIEGGTWPGVRLETVERLANALDVSMAELVAK